MEVIHPTPDDVNDLGFQEQLKTVGPLATRTTTMEHVASTLAVMFMEKHLLRGGTIEIPSIGVVITREDLFGPQLSNEAAEIG